MITTLLLDATSYAYNFSNTAVSYRDYILYTQSHQHTHRIYVTFKCGINKFYCYKTFLFWHTVIPEADQRCYGNVPTQILVTTNFTQIIQTCECLCCLAKGVFTLIDATPIYYEAGTFGYWFELKNKHNVMATSEK